MKIKYSKSYAAYSNKLINIEKVIFSEISSEKVEICVIHIFLNFAFSVVGKEYRWIVCVPAFYVDAED